MPVRLPVPVPAGWEAAPVQGSPLCPGSPAAESVSLGHEALPGNHMGEAAAPRAAQCAAAAGAGRAAGRAAGAQQPLPGGGTHGSARLPSPRPRLARFWQREARRLRDSRSPPSSPRMAAPEAGSTGQCPAGTGRATAPGAAGSTGAVSGSAHRECSVETASRTPGPGGLMHPTGQDAHRHRIPERGSLLPGPGGSA